MIRAFQTITMAMDLNDDPKLTQVEWNAIHPDFKTIIDGQHCIMRDGKLIAVQVGE